MTDIKTTETTAPKVKATQHANRKNRRAAAAKNKTARKAAAPRSVKRQGFTPLADVRAYVATADGKKPLAEVVKDHVVAKGNKPAAKTEKVTDPKLVKVVLDHAAKNKDRNGWDKVLRWAPDTLKELLAGAKTENAAIKRTRAKIEEGASK